MITSLISGGLLGLIGTICTNLFDHFKKKQDINKEISLRELDIKMMDKEYQFREGIAQMHMETAMKTSADALMAASYEADKAAYSQKGKMGVFSTLLMVMVDFCRGMTRPGLTLYMAWEVHCLRIETSVILSGAGMEVLDTAQALMIYGRIVDMILFLASASFTWWFGTRLKQAVGKKSSKAV